MNPLLLQKKYEFLASRNVHSDTQGVKLPPMDN